MDFFLVAVGILLLISVIASKVTDRVGIPAVLLFLLLGMLAGSDGIGGIEFDDPAIAQMVGVLSLALILFSGGLDTDLRFMRLVLKQGFSLSTLGVLVTALVMGLFIHYILGLPPLIALLIGAIISSTDAAAVFSVLRSKGVGLKGKLQPLLELESGSNDPMAVFLTIGILQLIQQPDVTSILSLAAGFLTQMSLGALVGYLFGLGLLFLINRLRLGYEGLYPVLTLAGGLLTFGFANLVGGSGFLAVYLAGITVGSRDFIHKRSLLRFHDGLAWLMQIGMFLTLGLLVFPSELPSLAAGGLLTAAGLLFLARPISVFASLALADLTIREKLFVSWVGLRGAAPIVLATFPLLAGLPQADLIFNLVFFVVLASVILQGTSIVRVARFLKVAAPAETKRTYPIEYVPVQGMMSEMTELPVPPKSQVAGLAIVELGLPNELLVVLVARGEEYLVPSGSTVLQEGDILLVLSEKTALERVQAQFEKKRVKITPDLEK